MDNADLALARMRVVGTKNCLYGTCQDCVNGFPMIAMESYSYTGLKRAPYRGRKIVQRPALDLANWGAASVSLWKSPCDCSSS